MTGAQWFLLILAFLFFFVGLICLRIRNEFAYSAISFGFSFVSVVLAICNPFNTSKTVIFNNPQPQNYSNESSDVTVHYDIPDSALSYNGHHYYIYEDVKAFKDAVQNCNNRGGYLAVINNEAENEELYDYMKRMGFEEAFFGLCYNASTDSWVYIDGKEPPYTDWGKNSKGVQEPNNSGGKEVNVQLDVHMKSGHWNDARFGAEVRTPEGDLYKDRYAYICEWNY